MSGTIADSNFGRIAFISEGATYGQTPSTPTLQILRSTQASFEAQKETIVSEEVRSDRMVSTLAEVAAMSGGSLGYELSLGGTWDTLIEAALCGTLSTAFTVTNVATTATTNFSGTGVGSNVVAGQWVFASGFTNAANNGWHRVTSVTNSALIVVSTVLVNETAAVGNTLRGRMIRNGAVKRSFSIEQAFTDINQFLIFRGQRLGTWSLEASAGQIVTGQFGFQGASTAIQGTTWSSALTAATTTQVVNATSNVGAVMEGSTLTALTTAIQSFSVNVDNALRNQMAIGSKFPVNIGYGRQTVSGSLTAYFANANLFTKFLNHTASGISVAFSDAAGNQFRVTVPRVFFSTSNPQIAGIDQDVMETIEWTAVLDPTTNCQIQVDIITV